MNGKNMRIMSRTKSTAHRFWRLCSPIIGSSLLGIKERSTVVGTHGLVHCNDVERMATCNESAGLFARQGRGDLNLRPPDKHRTKRDMSPFFFFLVSNVHVIACLFLLVLRSAEVRTRYRCKNNISKPSAWLLISLVSAKKISYLNNPY